MSSESMMKVVEIFSKKELERMIKKLASWILKKIPNKSSLLRRSWDVGILLAKAIALSSCVDDREGLFGSWCDLNRNNNLKAGFGAIHECDRGRGVIPLSIVEIVHKEVSVQPDLFKV